MKTIKLLSLTLSNFKGIRHFELGALGENVHIFGDNATGKTTLADAFIWLLFDKDSNNKKDFEIKTLENGKVINNLEHEVEAELMVDGQELVLKKTYKEKWTKKRGAAKRKFDGHTTKYEIDGVPSKKKEFTNKVASIVDEDIFKLLTNPSYFNEQLHWKKRRDLLLEIAGDVLDEDVILSNEDLKKLTDILGKRSIDDHKKIIKEKRKEINDQLDKIPVRIDEINRNMPQLDDLKDATGIGLHLNELSKKIDEKQQQINDIQNGSEVNKVKTQISDIDLQISNVKNEHVQQGQDELYKLKAKLQEEKSNVNIIQSKIKNQEQQKSNNDAFINDYQKQMNELREQWATENEKEFDHESNCKCPTCEQDLPQEQITEISTKFNRDKSEKLEQITGKGKQLATKVESLKEQNETIDTEIQKLNEQVKTKEQAIAKLESEIKDAQSSIRPIEENTTYNKLMQDRQALEQQIANLQQSVDDSVQKVQKEIESLKEQQSALQLDQSQIELSEKSLNRIKELEQQEKDLAVEFEKLEEELHLAEEFIRTKVDMLTEKINGKFKHARFNLFKNNINGGLEEICDTTYKGVPYGSGLNNAARINVGLDIINTLSAHYGVQAPIFIDNAEGVTRLIDIDSQVISLVVSESDKELRIEGKSEKESGVA